MALLTITIIHATITVTTSIIIVTETEEPIMSGAQMDPIIIIAVAAEPVIMTNAIVTIVDRTFGRMEKISVIVVNRNHRIAKRIRATEIV